MSEHSTIELQVLTPLGAVRGADGVKTQGVFVPGIHGELGILPDHIPFLTPVRPGVLRFSEGGQSHEFAVGGGFVEVSAERTVTVLTDRVASKDDLDESEVRSAHKDCEARLKEASKGSTITQEFAAIELEYAWIQAQLDVLGIKP